MIQKLTILAALSFAVGTLALAQGTDDQMQIGPVHLTWSSVRSAGNSNSWHFTDAVATSKDYELQAATVVVDTTPASSGANFSKLTALGDPAKGTQVTGKFVMATEDSTYLIHGDQAVFVPETGRKNGGRIDFTGHVLVTVLSPKKIQGPALGHMEHMTVLTGLKPDYPQISGGPGTADFTPIPQGK